MSEADYERWHLEEKDLGRVADWALARRLAGWLAPYRLQAAGALALVLA
ncbi:MAG: hypothetical protein HY722_09470, partial [Planctomycetes bacterium]|nr:hypothetical protein [Planctomycetota bacterium]